MKHISARSRSSASFVLSALYASLVLLSATESRAQEEVSFTTFGGNEWWIEVYVDAAVTVEEVDVSVEGGAWRALSLQGWGAWATSFFVEPGSRLVFRALGADGQIATSPSYLWPSGELAGTLEEPPSEDEGAFSASFFGVSGNEWWVESHVDASEPLAGVDVRINGGAWQALAATLWGSWAASLPAPAGSVVELRARALGGEQVLSSRYSWPDATVLGPPLDDTPPDPPPAEEPAPEEPLPEEPPFEDEPAPETFVALFDSPRGNEWWVEIDVSSESAIVAVDARANGGVWVPLAETGWGSWAASFFVPAGSVVELRALASNGAFAHSAGYAWPGGEVVFPPPDDGAPPNEPEDPPPEPEDPPAEPPPPGEPSVLNATFDDERVRYLGRVDDRVDGQPACSWTGCGFVIVTDATSVWMEVEANVRNGAIDYLRVQVDDQPARVLELSDGNQEVALATDLGSGTHTITLYKRTEPQVGALRFLGLELEGGDLLDAPLPDAPRLLVIGDSITAAYGNAGDGPFCGFTPATEDGWNSYANLTAQRFGGEAVITAFSGKGVYRNRSLSDPWTMPLLFDRKDVFDAASHAPFADIDAVVVNLGTNDFASTNPPAQPFIDAYVAFADDLRGRFPTAPIVLAMGPMLSDEWPVGLAQRSTLRGYLEEVIATRAAAGDADVYLVENAPQSTEGLLGCDYHPHVVTHERMADELAEALALITGW